VAGPAAHDSGTYEPDNPDIDNGNAISLGVRFMVDEALSLGGVTFYAPATNTGTYSFALYETTSDDDPNGSGTGTLIDSGSIAAASITPSAWNDLTLPVDVEPGIVYTARVHTSSGRFVNTPNAFVSAGLSGNGVTLLQTGASPSPPTLGSMLNGVFLDNALGYPNTRFNDADYGIDVWLATEDAIDAALAVTFPAFTAAIAAEAEADAVLTASLPAFTAAATGDGLADGPLTATFPAFTAAVAGAASVDAVLSATFPAFVVAMSDSVTAAARSTAAVTAGRTSTTAVSAARTSTSTVG
jgi:hypothetical protein